MTSGGVLLVQYKKRGLIWAISVEVMLIDRDYRLASRCAQEITEDLVSVAASVRLEESFSQILTLQTQ